MRYALTLNEDNRILSATYEKYASDKMVLVDTLPVGDIHDYKYVNGNYVNEPLDKPEITKKKTTYEQRIIALENENMALKEGSTMQAAQVNALCNQIDFYEECIIEMAKVVYA